MATNAIPAAELDLQQGNPSQRVYHFNPDDSPEKKAAIAGQARDQLKPKGPEENGGVERGLSSAVLSDSGTR